MYYLQHEKTGQYVSAIIKLNGENGYAVYFKENPGVAGWRSEKRAKEALDRLLDCERTNPVAVALELKVVDPDKEEEVAHMNEMAAVQASAPARSLMEIEADILAQKRTIGRSIVIIGQDLIEAKSKMEHGLWGTWLEERVNFSQSTAENYMKIAEQVGGNSLLLNLPYTKILALLAVPAEEREEFATDNHVEDKSVAQIKQLIKEKEEAERRARSIESTLSAVNAKTCHLNKEIDSLKNQLEKERAKEPDTVTVEKEVIPPDYDAIKAQNAKLEDQLKTAMVRLNQAEDSLEEAEERASRAQAEAQRAKMEQIDTAEPEDPLEVASFAHACFDFTGALYAAPIGAKYFAGKSAEDLQRYRLVANSVLTWAQNTLRAIGEAEAMQTTGGDDYVVA